MLTKPSFVALHRLVRVVRKHYEMVLQQHSYYNAR